MQKNVCVLPLKCLVTLMISSAVEGTVHYFREICIFKKFETSLGQLLGITNLIFIGKTVGILKFSVFVIQYFLYNYFVQILYKLLGKQF